MRKSSINTSSAHKHKYSSRVQQILTESQSSHIKEGEEPVKKQLTTDAKIVIHRKQFKEDIIFEPTQQILADDSQPYQTMIAAG